MTEDLRIQHLARNLVEITTKATQQQDRGQRPAITWEEVDRSTFDLTLTRSTIRIESHNVSDYPYTLTIRDETGQVVDRVNEDQTDFNYYLDPLFAAAKRNARGIDEKLTEIMIELGIDPFPAGENRAPFDDDEPPY